MAKDGSGCLAPTAFQPVCVDRPRVGTASTRVLESNVNRSHGVRASWATKRVGLARRLQSL